MKTLVAILALSSTLIGCGHNSPIRVATYPLPDKELLQAPPEYLVLLQDDAALTDVSKTITQNYTTYKVIAARLEMLQKWVIKIHEESINVNGRTTNSKEEIR